MDQKIKNYHITQYEQPYRSTEIFVDWIDKIIDKQEKAICDMACGGGANLLYLANKYPDIVFEGIELDSKLVDYANKMLSINKVSDRVVVKQGDWYNLPECYKSRYSGIISFQTLSWLPEYSKAIKCLIDLQPTWIAISSLFYEGSIDYTIKVKDYTCKNDKKEYRESYYNIYSLVKVRELFKEYGYSEFKFEKFEIDIDLEKNIRDGLGTYTKKLEDGSRIQISGGLMLPWYFIYASK